MRRAQSSEAIELRLLDLVSLDPHVAARHSADDLDHLSDGGSNAAANVVEREWSRLVHGAQERSTHVVEMHIVANVVEVAEDTDRGAV